MKIRKLVIAIMLCVFIVSGCSKKEQTTDSKGEKVLNQIKKEAENSSGNIDVDLTQLSSTMVYAEVYNMMNNPEEYLGKTVRIQGMYKSDYDDMSKKSYHFIIIADAEACCEGGLEFVLDKESATYPKQKADAKLTGTFESYEKDGYTYYRIRGIKMG